MTRVEEHLLGYLEAIVARKIFKAQDFGEGISKVVQFMPELVLDCPMIHEYLWKNVMVPLIRWN